MFTGLVQQVGRVRNVRRGPKGATIHVECSYEGVSLGESIAVDGACLTVARLAKGGFEAFASMETLQRTTLGDRKQGDRLHLERALRADERMGGHVVTGHVDGIGRLRARTPLGESETVTFEVSEQLAPFVAPKGAVSIDGVSLTVNEVRGPCFDVVLVPYTRKETTFDERPPDAAVNVEVDVLAKYVARLLGKPGVDGSGGDGVSLDLLQRQGYL